MTVKEAASVLTDAKRLVVTWGPSVAADFKPNDLMLDAFSDYLVQAIRSYDDGENSYEIEIAVKPLRASEAGCLQ